MTLIDFNASFGTEEQCRSYLYAKRWPNGYVCPKCSHNEHYNITSRNRYQCKSCNHQASVTSGTIMDRTRTPLTKWFLAMYLMSSDKRGISALSLKSKLGISYNTAWTMAHKIRHAMGKRDENYSLGGIVELDDAFFGSPSSGGKRGRGTDKAAVLVSVSLNEAGKPRFAKMEVVENVDSEAINAFARESIAAGSEVRTDGLPAYAPLQKNGYSLVQKKYDPGKDSKHLHWTHIFISNAKAFINGTYHGLDSLHLQRYLDEFCYRLNRRWFPRDIFGALAYACVRAGVIRNYGLVG